MTDAACQGVAPSVIYTLSMLAAHALCVRSMRSGFFRAGSTAIMHCKSEHAASFVIALWFSFWDGTQIIDLTFAGLAFISVMLVTTLVSHHSHNCATSHVMGGLW